MSKFLKSLAIITTALIIAGCSEPKLDNLDPGDVILAFGDSLTAGVGASAADSYPEVLARYTGITVVNAGISGETTAEGLQRLPQVIAENSPRLLLLLEGGNDILRNVDYQQIQANLDQMIQLAQNAGVQVVLIAVPEKKLLSKSAPFYSELAEKYDLVFDSTTIGELMRTPSKKSDTVHFNKAGYESMAHHIYELLVEHGAVD